MPIRRSLRPLALLALVACPLAAASTPADGAAPADAAAASPRLVMAHVEHVVPGKVAQYEAATRSFIELLKQNRAAVPGFAFRCLQGEDLSYAYISPMRGFATEDAVLAGFDRVAQAAGAAWADTWKKSGEAMLSADEDVMMEIPDGTYTPATPRHKPEEERYFEIDIYRVLPGMEDAARAVAAEWRALHERHHIANGYRVYQLVSGHDMPRVIVVIPAKDPADLAAVEATEEKELGAERQALLDKTFAITRGYDSKRYWLRPDLSLPPAR